MNIVYLSGSILPSTAANAVHVMQMCSAWAAQGHRVTLVARGPSDVSEAEIFARYGVAPAFRIVRVPRPSIRIAGAVIYALGVRRAVAAIARREPIDLLYARNLHALTLCQGLAPASAYEAHKPPASLSDLVLERRAFRHPTFRRLVVISDALRERYEAMADRGMHVDDPIVAHDAATLPASPPSDCPPAVGYVGNMSETVGVPLMLELARRLPRIPFHMVGGKPENVERWKREGGDLPNVTWHGFVPHAELDRYYAAFGIGLAPYPRTHYKAGFMSPMKLFEYMAHGRVVLASDLAVCEEVLTDGETGMMCPPEHVDQWVERLEQLVSDDGLRTRIADAGRELCRSHYTWAARARSILSQLGVATPSDAARTP